MTSHPRLLASAHSLERLREPVTPFLEHYEREVVESGEKYAASPELAYGRDLHNSLLLRGREIQSRVITLLVCWFRTGEARFRDAALADIWRLGAFDFWAWEQQRLGNEDPNAEFDLSCGENSATLALAYDWLHATLNEEERARFREIALRRCLQPFLANTEGEKRAWWFEASYSNWNTVCAGGAGMVALAFYEELGEPAEEVLRRADGSVAAYMNSLEASEGGWLEGIGYWNYGHRYAYWYLLSHERASGRPHPLLEQKGARQTLRFPLDFCPNGHACGFGDVNRWHPLAFHYAAAARYGDTAILTQLDRLVGKSHVLSEAWPNAAEMLLFHPRDGRNVEEQEVQVRRFYPAMDWGMLADRIPNPHLYLSVRGGACGRVPHSHLDLLSFHCVVEGEHMIDNIAINGGPEYLDTTFSDRRFELFETTPASKNTLLLNGVGVLNPAQARTTPIEGAGWKGFRVDVTGFLYWRNDPSLVPLCTRDFMLFEEGYALIVDRMEMKFPGRAEARFHSYAEVQYGERRALLNAGAARLTIAFASNVASTLHSAVAPLTTPGPRCHMLRWCTDTRTHQKITFTTLLAPGDREASVTLEDGLRVDIDGISRRIP